MTVEELIEVLSHMPSGAQVVLRSAYDYRDGERDEITEVTVTRDGLEVLID